MTTSPITAEQVEICNSTGRDPVVFIHGLWLLPSSWDRWAVLFEEAGYTTLRPAGPTTRDGRGGKRPPEVFAHKTVGRSPITSRTSSASSRKPALVGHSFGGLLAQILAGRGVSAATVAIDPAPFRGVLPLPISALKSAAPVLGNPLNRGRAVPLTYEQFRFAFANAVTRTRPRSSTTRTRCRPPVRRSSRRRPPTSTRGPKSRSTRRTRAGPLLIISGEKDHTVPWSIANASYKKQKRNKGVTEIVEMPAADTR